MTGIEIVFRLHFNSSSLYHEFRITTKIISPLEVMTELKTDDNYDVASFFQKQFIEANEVSHDGAGASGD